VTRTRTQTTQPDLRAELAAVMKATLADEATAHDWTYAAVRPMPMPTTSRAWHAGLRVRGDCSKGVQYLCWWTPGVPDPMRQGWDPYGNSQTLWVRLQHYGDKLELQVGDFVTFGVDGDEHAAMVLEAPSAENGFDPLLWSFGHQGAPNSYRLSQDRRPQQYLRNPIPTYVPTPLDKARARSGWFAWVAWRLGEGDYAPYGKASPKARPNVPKRIPLSWWKRYAKFVARRKHANKPTTA
jgi:hypothetical protein